MENYCNSDSITCKVVSGILAVVVAAVIICPLLKCFEKKLSNCLRLELDIGVKRRNRVSPCIRVAEHSAVSDVDEGPVGMVGIPTHSISHTGMWMNAENVWPASSTVFTSTSTLIYNNGTITMPPHTVIQQSIVPQQQSPPSLMNQTPEHSDRTQNIDQAQRDQQHTASSESPKSKNCFPTLWRIIYFFLMSMFLYDWCMDLILTAEYCKKGEVDNAFLTFGPYLISVFFGMIILSYTEWIHTCKGLTCLPGRTCLSIAVILVMSPFAKAFIYGWIVLFGEQSWYKRWYLHALTFLQLVEVCIEGIPQLIFEGDLFLSENQTFYKGIGRTEIWTIIVSLFAVAVSITSVTTTLDREEDVREIYDEKLKERNATEDEEHYWEQYKMENTCLWYFYTVVVFFGKSFEYIPRCIIYIMFAEEFGFKALSIVIGVYLCIYICISVFCFYTITTNNKSIEALGLLSIVVGAFANLFFCYEWLFRLRWSKKYFYFRYYIFFYAVNLALGISNMLSSEKRDFHIVFGFVTVVCQPLLFLLRMWIREKMSENIK